jgi:hypothetical protein
VEKFDRVPIFDAETAAKIISTAREAQEILQQEIAVELLLKEGCSSREEAVQFIDDFKSKTDHIRPFNPFDIPIVWGLVQTANRELQQ